MPLTPVRVVPLIPVHVTCMPRSALPIHAAPSVGKPDTSSNSSVVAPFLMSPLTSAPFSSRFFDATCSGTGFPACSVFFRRRRSRLLRGSSSSSGSGSGACACSGSSSGSGTSDLMVPGRILEPAGIFFLSPSMPIRVFPDLPDQEMRVPRSGCPIQPLPDSGRSETSSNSMLSAPLGTSTWVPSRVGPTGSGSGSSTSSMFSSSLASFVLM